MHNTVRKGKHTRRAKYSNAPPAPAHADEHTPPALAASAMGPHGPGCSRIDLHLEIDEALTALRQPSPSVAGALREWCWCSLLGVPGKEAGTQEL